MREKGKKGVKNLEAYHFRDVFKKERGLQLHVFDLDDDCIRVLYLDPNTLSPLKHEGCSRRLKVFIKKQRRQINHRLDSSVDDSASNYERIVSLI